MSIPYQTFGHRGCFSQDEIDKIIKLPISIDLFDILELSADEIVWLPTCEELRRKYIYYKDDRYLDSLLDIYPYHALRY